MKQDETEKEEGHGVEIKRKKERTHWVDIKRKKRKNTLGRDKEEKERENRLGGGKTKRIKQTWNEKKRMGDWNKEGELMKQSRERKWKRKNEKQSA